MCSGGSSSPILCSNGQYAPIGSRTCTNCYPGYYCHTPSIPLPFMCDSFSYSTNGSTKCTYCPIGRSCTSFNSAICGTGYLSLEG